MRADDVRLQRVEVDLDDAVEVLPGVSLDLGVAGEQVGVLVGELGELGAAGRAQVGGGVAVVGEDGRGRAELGAHVADGRLAGGADGVDAGAEVLDDGVGAAGDGEDARELEDDVLGGGPAAHRAGELHADEARVEHLPREARHHVDRVGAADAGGERAEPARVGRVGVGADDHEAGEGVVLQDDLVDDAGAGPPEAEPVLRGRGAEEVEDLAALALGEVGVGERALERGDEMVAVDGGGDGGRGLARLHELEDGHLAGHVLQTDAVGAEVEVALAGEKVGVAGVVEVSEQDLLGVGERPSEAVAHGAEPLLHLPVRLLDEGWGRINKGSHHVQLSSRAWCLWG